LGGEAAEAAILGVLLDGIFVHGEVCVVVAEVGRGWGSI
jgi:hypothetical protein